jgi:hypothetical protein
MTELPLFSHLTARQTVKAAKLLDCLIDELHDGQWHTAKELGPILRTNERVIRKCADLSRGRIVGSDAGYKLTRFCTIAELDHVEARLLSQAAKMQDRAREIRIARNRGVAA